MNRPTDQEILAQLRRDRPTAVQTAIEDWRKANAPTDLELAEEKIVTLEARAKRAFEDWRRSRLALNRIAHPSTFPDPRPPKTIAAAALLIGPPC